VSRPSGPLQGAGLEVSAINRRYSSPPQWMPPAQAAVAFRQVEEWPATPTSLPDLPPEGTKLFLKGTPLLFQEMLL